jgi:hypothetical protein
MNDGLQFELVKLCPLELKALRGTFGKGLLSYLSAERATLPFYRNPVSLYRFTDHASSAPNVRYAFYRNCHFQAHNWTNEPIYTLNEEDELCLDGDNLLSYVRFFFHYTRAELGRFIPMLDAGDVQSVHWRDSASVHQRKQFGRAVEPVRIRGKAPDGCFLLRVSVLFRTALFYTDLYVAQRDTEEYCIGELKLDNEEIVLEDLKVATEAMPLADMLGPSVH